MVVPAPSRWIAQLPLPVYALPRWSRPFFWKDRRHVGLVFDDPLEGKPAMVDVEVEAHPRRIHAQVGRHVKLRDEDPRVLQAKFLHRLL